MSFIQTANSGTPSGTSSSKGATFASAQTAGNLNVVIISYGKSSAGLVTNVINSVTDTSGNTYVADNTWQAYQTGGVDSLGQIMYHASGIASASAGANTVTVALSTAVPYFTVTVLEESGVSAVDAIAGASLNTGGGNVASSGSLTTTVSGDTLVGSFAFYDSVNATPSLTAGFTQRSSYYTNYAADQVGVATGSYSVSAVSGGPSGWVAQLVAYRSGITTINATVSMAAKAVSGLTLNPRITKDATFLCQAGVHATTFRCDLGSFGHAIIQGKATTSSFTGRNTRNQTDSIGGRATSTFAPKVTHSATLAISGTASGSRFSPFSNPTIVNANLNIYAFAANNIAIGFLFGQASLRLLANIPAVLLAINGRATLTPAAQVVRNRTNSLAGKAQGIFSAKVTGAGTINATLVVTGRASLSETGFLTHNASVVIQAGNPLFISVFAQAQFQGRAAFATLAAFNTHRASVAIAGRMSGLFSVNIQGNPNIFGTVLIQGRASFRPMIVSTPVSGVAAISGRAFLTLNPQAISSLPSTLGIQGRASFRPQAFVQGGLFDNAVVVIQGRAALSAAVRQNLAPMALLSGTASLLLFPGGTIRAGVLLQGFARLTPAVPKQLLQWSSAHTLQYKIWQYNTESMVRVLGSSWTTTSVGLSFQSVAMEVVSTEAGWGS